MGFIAWIVVGAIAGFLANAVMGSREGLLMMVVLGVVGGLVGGFIATSLLKVGSVNGINLESIAIATLGATMHPWPYLTCKRSLVRVQCRPPAPRSRHDMTAITAVSLCQRWSMVTHRRPRGRVRK